MADIYYVADRKSVTHKKGIQSEGMEVQDLFDKDQLSALEEKGIVTKNKPECLKAKEAQAKPAKEEKKPSKPAAKPADADK